MALSIKTPHIAAAAYMLIMGHQLLGFERHPFRPGSVRFLFPREARADLDEWYDTIEKLRVSIPLSPAVPSHPIEGAENNVSDPESSAR